MFAANLADLTRLERMSHAFYLCAIQPVMTHELLDAEDTVDGKAVLLSCNEDRLSAIVDTLKLLRQKGKIPRGAAPFRFYHQSGKGWKRITA